MSSHCKVVKVLSLLMFVLGLLAIIAGAVFVFAAPAVEGLEGVDDPVGTATALGAVFVVTGVLYLVVAVLGIRGANNPSKLGAFIVAAGVIAAINVVEAVLAGVSGGSAWQNAVLAGVALAGVFQATAARKETMRF